MGRAAGRLRKRPVNAQNVRDLIIRDPQGPGDEGAAPPVSGSFLQLVDGSSFLLLVDGSSKLKLASST